MDTLYEPHQCDLDSGIERERETEKERWKGLTQEGVGIMKAWNSTAEKSSGKVPPNFPVP